MSVTLQLNDGSVIPTLSFGLYKVAPEETERVVAAGLDAGYRLIDGAEFYGNEREVGAVVKQTAEHGIARETLTLTSKFWGDPQQTPQAARTAFDASEQLLGTRIDVYMIHWPRPARNTFVDVWRELIALRAFHREHGIVTQAWSPVGRARILDDPTIQAIAATHGVSPAQAIIRWHLQLGGALIPKSTHPHRLKENRDVDGFTLSDGDMARIAALETGERTGTHPDERQ